MFKKTVRVYRPKWNYLALVFNALVYAHIPKLALSIFGSRAIARFYKHDWHYLLVCVYRPKAGIPSFLILGHCPSHLPRRPSGRPSHHPSHRIVRRTARGVARCGHDFVDERAPRAGLRAARRDRFLMGMYML